MILIAGAGAMAHAAKEMRKIQRGINRRVAKSRSRARTPRLEYTGYETEYTEFPCKYLCGTCGYYVDELGDEAGGEGSRSAERDGEHSATRFAEPCPACGEQNWIDLSIVPVVDRMRELEEEERNRAPRWIKMTVAGVGLLVFGGAAVVFQLVGSTTGFVATLLAALFVFPIAYFGLPQPLSLVLLRGRDRMPDRWHEPVPLPDEESPSNRTLEGVEVHDAGETCTAPVSGRECLAYQLCVLFDTPGDARPPEWVLQEQHAEDVRLGDEGDVDPESVYLESAVELAGTTGDLEMESMLPDRRLEIGVEREELETFLRRRGLFLTDGVFHFYEACLQPGERVDVECFEGPFYVVEHSDSPEREELPQLPEPSSDDEQFVVSVEVPATYSPGSGFSVDVGRAAAYGIGCALGFQFLMTAAGYTVSATVDSLVQLTWSLLPWSLGLGVAIAAGYVGWNVATSGEGRRRRRVYLREGRLEIRQVNDFGHNELFGADVDALEGIEVADLAEGDRPGEATHGVRIRTPAKEFILAYDMGRAEAERLRERLHEAVDD